MFSKKTNITQTFNVTAQNYGGGSDFFINLGRQLVDWAKIPAGVAALDYGTGRGAVLFQIIETTHNTGAYSAIDISPEMIKELKSDLSHMPEIRAELAVMDGENLRFDDASFDVVVSGATIHLLGDKKAGLREIYRTLKPGGFLAFSIPGNPPSGPWAFHLELYEKYLPTIDPLIWQPSNNGTVDYDSLLIELGYENLAFEHKSILTHFTGPDDFWNWQMSHSRRGFINALSEDNRERYKAEVLEALNSLGTEIVMERDSLFVKAFKRVGI